MKTLGNKGFTLIELLVVVAIIGILAAIAIPQFATYRQKGYDAQANSDLRNAATAEEAYFATNQTYKTATCASPGPCTDLPGLSVSKGTTVAMVAAATSFTGTSTNSGGTKSFSYNSLNGGIQ